MCRWFFRSLVRAFVRSCVRACVCVCCCGSEQQYWVAGAHIHACRRTHAHARARTRTHAPLILSSSPRRFRSSACRRSWVSLAACSAEFLKSCSFCAFCASCRDGAPSPRRSVCAMELAMCRSRATMTSRVFVCEASALDFAESKFFRNSVMMRSRSNNSSYLTTRTIVDRDRNKRKSSVGADTRWW